MRAFPVTPGSPIPSVPIPGIVAPAVTLLVIRSGSKNRSYIQSSTELMGKVTDAKEVKNPFPEGNEVSCPPHPDPRSSSRGETLLSSGLYFLRPAQGLARHWSPVRAAAST